MTLVKLLNLSESVSHVENRKDNYRGLEGELQGKIKPNGKVHLVLETTNNNINLKKKAQIELKSREQ